MKFLISLGLTLFLLLFFPLPAFAADKRIDVNLTTQRLTAYDGQTQVYSFLISSGKWNHTPIGTFYPKVKLASTRMKGPGYDLPNVPYVIYYANENIPVSAGYSLHGAYWHNNFGTPMSHGCINEPIPQAKLIYDWIEYSTPIHVHY